MTPPPDRLEEIQQQEPSCGWCGGPHRFDTVVPSPVWNQNIRAAGLPEFLCTSCILRAFARHGQSFTATLWGEEFYGTAIEVRVDEAEALDARALSDENTSLRAQLATERRARQQLEEAHEEESRRRYTVEANITRPADTSDEAITRAAQQTASNLLLFAATWPEFRAFGLAVKELMQHELAALSASAPESKE